MTYKKLLVLDFDGVIHSYTSKWVDAYTIPDPPVVGAFDFIIQALEYFDVAVYSSRSSAPSKILESGAPGTVVDGVSAMQDWFTVKGMPLEILKQLKFPKEKPPAFLTIDDRVMLFEGLWPNPVELLEFTPWNKKHPQEAPKYMIDLTVPIEQHDKRVVDMLNGYIFQRKGPGPVISLQRGYDIQPEHLRKALMDFATGRGVHGQEMDPGSD